MNRIELIISFLILTIIILLNIDVYILNSKFSGIEYSSPTIFFSPVGIFIIVAYMINNINDDEKKRKYLRIFQISIAITFVIIGITTLYLSFFGEDKYITIYRAEFLPIIIAIPSLIGGSYYTFKLLKKKDNTN